MSDLQKKINQSLMWAEHQARVDCELRGGDVSEHWASIISSQYDELVSKVEALTEINRLQPEENKQLAEDNAKLREALAGLKLDSIKVIDNLVNTGCDEAWSVIKLNNMITDIEDALKTECTTCDNSNEAEECKQLQQDKAELVELVESAYIEGCHDGYREGLSDGHDWASSKNNIEPDESWDISESKEKLEKHKCD